MTPRYFVRFFLFSFLLLGGHAMAADDVRTWLKKMHAAAQRLDYEGVFVYQHGTQLEAMRIVHKAEKGMVRERLISLNGAPREIIRNEREVLCTIRMASS